MSDLIFKSLKGESFMNYKKSNLLYVLCTLCLMAGCTDLVTTVEDGIGRETVDGGSVPITDPAAALTGTYSQLNAFGDQANMYALMEHTSDEMMGPTRGTDWSDFGVWRQLHAHTWDPSHGQILTAWNQLNSGVFRASQVINAPGADAQTIAEARFLRAFFMFYVMDFYGQVPFREPDASVDDVPSVKDRGEAFDFIVQDLTAARGNLPSLGSGEDAGRATQEAVDFLLAKLYLNKAVYTQSTPSNPTDGPYQFSNADMDEVIARVGNLENNPYLEITPEYWDNFHWENTTRSTELIFVIPNQEGNTRASVFNRYYMTLHYNQTPSGWNGFTTLADFYNTFTDDNDSRKRAYVQEMSDATGLNAGFLVGQQYGGYTGPGSPVNPLTDRGGNPLVFTPDVDLFYSNERMGIRAIKYLVKPDQTDNPGTDHIFFRYANALLMKAEAHLRKGETGPALTIINNIRQLRGAAALSSLDEQVMLDERGRELYWEGWRRHDQVRFGTYTGEWDQKPASAPHRVMFPVPQRALDTNPNLVQIQGY
jgi:starch-binding outer membrane protein, SusD/RagB family